MLGVWFAACVVAWVPQPMGRRFDLVILNFRNLGFLAGILVFLLHARIRPALGPWLVGAGIALLALGLPLVPDLGYGRASVARGYYLLPFALLVLGLIACERDGLLRVPRWIGFLGDASYSIYLTHWLALYALLRPATTCVSATCCPQRPTGCGDAARHPAGLSPACAGGAPPPRAAAAALRRTAPCGTNGRLKREAAHKFQGALHQNAPCLLLQQFHFISVQNNEIARMARRESLKAQ